LPRITKMLKMKKIKDFLKKYWLFIFLSAVLAILLTLKLNQKGPQGEIKNVPTTLLEALPKPQSRFAEKLEGGIPYEILFSELEFQKVPKNLPAYKIKKNQKEEILSSYSQIISFLGFRNPPKTEKRQENEFLIWQEKENYLRVDISSGQFSFVGRVSLTQKKPENAQEIKLLAEETLNLWKLTPKKIVAREVKGFVPVGSELSPVTNLEKATFFKIFFEQTIDEFPLVGLGPARNQIEATLDRQGTLISLFYNLHQIETEKGKDYPIKSLNETVEEIKRGEGQIIPDPTEEEIIFPQKKDIQKIQILSLKIAYYETIEAQEFYQPIFLFEGKAILNDGKTKNIKIILPAIAPEWLKP